MLLKQRQQQILSQKMVMSQQMLNAVALLNLSSEELQEEVIKEVKRNPALIFKTSSRVSAASAEEGDKHQSFLESIEDDSHKTLQAHLIEQAGESITDEYVLDAAMLIIQNLDQNGFYWVPLEELFAELLTEKKIRHAEIKKALNIVRRLEPIGCACTGVKESLIVQAGIFCESPKTHEILDIYKNIHSLCVKIIKEHYEVLSFVSDLKLFVKKLAQKKIIIDFETAEELAELIRSLNPKPGLAYSRGADGEKFITPIAEIKREGDEFKIIINDEEIPALEISPEYERIKNSGSKEEKKEAADFLNKASLFMGVLAYRNQTILKVLTALVNFQEAFFLGRPCKPSSEEESEKMQPGYLKPLKQIDIAEIVGLSPSTVSRVSNQKYIRCEWGLFEIKDLFSPEVSGGLSKDYVEKAIREIIESDTEKKTDARISQILKERGIDIAVRTVNKYRKEIGLLHLITASDNSTAIDIFLELPYKKDMEITEIYTGPLFVKTWALPLDKKTVLLVDPGGTDEELMDYLKSKNAERLEIMLTHGHFDHVGGVPELMQKYPGSSLWIHSEDAGYLGQNGKKKHIACFSQIRAERYIKALKYDFPEPTGFLKDGDLVNGFKVLHTPGHTEGSVCFWNEEAKVLFSGDTLFYRSHGRTDLLGGDDQKIKASLKFLLKLPDETTVYPGHGSNTSIGAERVWIEKI